MSGALARLGVCVCPTCSSVTGGVFGWSWEVTEMDLGVGERLPVRSEGGAGWVGGWVDWAGCGDVVRGVGGGAGDGEAHGPTAAATRHAVATSDTRAFPDKLSSESPGTAPHINAIARASTPRMPMSLASSAILERAGAGCISLEGGGSAG